MSIITHNGPAMIPARTYYSVGQPDRSFWRGRVLTLFASLGTARQG